MPFPKIFCVEVRSAEAIASLYKLEDMVEGLEVIGEHDPKQEPEGLNETQTQNESEVYVHRKMPKQGTYAASLLKTLYILGKESTTREISNKSGLDFYLVQNTLTNLVNRHWVRVGDRFGYKTWSLNNAEKEIQAFYAYIEDRQIEATPHIAGLLERPVSERLRSDVDQDPR